jgi:hypothetical protein
LADASLIENELMYDDVQPTAYNKGKTCFALIMRQSPLLSESAFPLYFLRGLITKFRVNLQT